MRLLTILAASVILITGSIAFLSTTQFQSPSNTKPEARMNIQPIVHTATPVTTNLTPRIQAAILLDVSNSMDGLIDQAKAQLWNMVSVMGKAQSNNTSPQIEIALYEYGRSTNNETEGYVKQISGFTTDLDQLSKNLFGLSTNGGDEYCGHVLYSSLQQLNWDLAKENYKVIFIAGNEDFLQGNVSFSQACAEAKKKGVIVNTIYCGDRMQGIREHWNLGSECGNGSFTIINQNAKLEDIATPYDSALFVLNSKLNSTYIAYGYDGAAAYRKQEEVDKMNMTMSQSVAAKRVAVKGKASLYKNTEWDLVDAYDKDSTFIAKVDMKTLPDNLKNKSRAELKQVVTDKKVQRKAIQKEIEVINAKRESFIAMEKAKAATKNQNATLETEIERMIKEQAKRFNMIIQ